MRVAELMQTKVVSVHPDDTVAEAVVSMADAHVSALPVVSGGKLVGVISQSDLLVAEAEAGGAEQVATLLDQTPVRELMTPKSLTIEPDADVRDAAQQMLYADVHRLFVVDDGKLVGVISQTDIIRAVATRRL